MRYIDAEKLYENMLTRMAGTGFQSRALSIVDEQPTADVEEVRHGTADIIAENAGIDDAINVSECSCCEMTILTWGGEYPQYCSHCGAKMDGGKE